MLEQEGMQNFGGQISNSGIVIVKLGKIALGAGENNLRFCW